MGRGRSYDIFTVDSFTEHAFTGNPAAVCPLNSILPDETYQKIAFELNLSETAFVIPVDASRDFQTGDCFLLRWFTPASEVPLCGHATLATAHILLSHFKNSSPIITFKTVSGDLHCVTHEDGSIGMDLPQWNVRKPEDTETNLFRLLAKECVGDLPVDDVQYAPSNKKVIVVLNENTDRKTFESLKPNTDRLQQFDPTGQYVKGICITMKGSQTNGFVESTGNVYDFVARYFAPWFGVAEDPVTGSLYCALASYWTKVLGKTSFYVRQCSRRGGDLSVELRDDGRVYLRGKAVTVIKGQITF